MLFGILAYVASTGDALKGAALLAAYGLGFGLPYVIVGSLALRLPVNGGALRAVKSLFGLMLALGAFWYLRVAFPAIGRPCGWSLGLALVAAGLAVGAIHRHFDGGWKDRGLKLAGLAAAICGGSLLINSAVTGVNAEPWCDEEPDRPCLTQNAASHDLTVVVFGAEWCPWCKEMKKATLDDPRVVARLRGIGKVHVDTDRNEDLSKRFNIRGIPAVKFFDRQGNELPGGFEGAVGPEEFLQIVDKVEKDLKK